MFRRVVFCPYEDIVVSDIVIFGGARPDPTQHQHHCHQQQGTQEVLQERGKYLKFI